MGASLLKPTLFVGVMLYVLVAGVMWGTWLSLARTMTDYDADTFLADGQHMIDNLATIMAVLMIAAVVVGLAAAVLLFRTGSTTAGWLATVALLLMIGVLAITLATEVPIDNQIKTWTPATLPADWQEIRARWSAFHTVRTFLSLGAVAAAVGGALTLRPVPSTVRNAPSIPWCDETEMARRSSTNRTTRPTERKEYQRVTRPRPQLRHLTDGFGTGEGQSADAHFGHAGERLHEWMFATRWWQPGGSGGVDDAFAQQFYPGIGAEIMGAGKWGHPGWHEDPEWKGARGPNPPFHTPIFILTHHTRPSIEMEGGTTFHFLDASPAEALETARKAADGKDVRIGGGATMIRDFVAAGLIDYMHVVVVPILLGRGKRLWDGLEGLEKDYQVESTSSPSGVTHVTFTRTGVCTGLREPIGLA